ncbi:MAG: hypothetical protein OXD44_03850 [Gammaproteobacteria bacterium]|nr:hypothetical protein [Gammaproteobacteria bacterium]
MTTEHVVGILTEFISDLPDSINTRLKAGVGPEGRIMQMLSAWLICEGLDKKLAGPARLDLEIDSENDTAH